MARYHMKKKAARPSHLCVSVLIGLTLESVVVGQHPSGSLPPGDLQVKKPPYWDLENRTENPWRDQYQEFCSLFGQAKAKGEAKGKTVEGSGFANDYCVGDDVRAQVAGTGLFSESYEYIGTKQGAVKWHVNLAINGRVALKDDDCAGATLGYVEYYCTNSPQTGIFALLQHSSAETTSAGLGEVSLAYQGLTVSVSPTVSTGLGTYPDHDQNEDEKDGCLGGFYYRARSRAFVKFWANSILPASSDVEGRMAGNMAGSVILYEVPPTDCPQGG
jgi:hypothetical protein